MGKSWSTQFNLRLFKISGVFFGSQRGKNKIKRVRKKSHWHNFYMQNVPELYSLLGFFLFTCLPPPPHPHANTHLLQYLKTQSKNCNYCKPYDWNWLLINRNLGLWYRLLHLIMNHLLLNKFLTKKKLLLLSLPFFINFPSYQRGWNFPYVMIIFLDK